MIKQLKTPNSAMLTCKEVTCYNAPAICYYVVTTEEKAYLFRTLDNTETFMDYRGRIYHGCDDEKEVIELVYLDSSSSAEDLNDRAKRYSDSINSAYLERKTENKDSLLERIKKWKSR